MRRRLRLRMSATRRYAVEARTAATRLVPEAMPVHLEHRCGILDRDGRSREHALAQRPLAIAECLLNAFTPSTAPT